MDREQSMAEQDLASGVDLHQVADIVSRYVRHHQVPTDQLTTLIIEVHRAFAGLARPAGARAAATGGADPTLSATG